MKCIDCKNDLVEYPESRGQSLFCSVCKKIFNTEYMKQFYSISHRHPLGVHADNDGNICYKYDDIEGLYPVDVFKFCPDCGESLRCEHVFEPIPESYDVRTCSYRARCIKCGFKPD